MHKLSEKYYHWTFELGLVIKGVDGIFELIGGILLLVVKPESLNALAMSLTQHELVEDSRDFIANHLVQAMQELSHATVMFAALYLLSHGLIKLILIISLWQKKLWAYPAAIAVFGAFCIYQIYRYSYSHAPSLLVLTALDLIVIFLTWHEYGFLKKLSAQSAKENPVN